MKFERAAHFEDHSGLVPVYDRLKLPQGGTLEGPCIVEQPDTTTVIYPQQKAVTDAAGNLVIHIRTKGDENEGR